MSKKGTKKCCICGQYDEPRYQAYKEFISNPPKFSDEESKEISDKLIDRIRDMCGIDVDNDEEQ